jgi:hypothetical protein
MTQLDDILVRKARLPQRSRQSSSSDIAIIFGPEPGSGCPVPVTHNVEFYSVLQFGVAVSVIPYYSTLDNLATQIVFILINKD